MADATSAFDSTASDYELSRRRLVPPHDAFYGAAVEAIGVSGLEPKRILDIGAGTGMITRFVREAYPDAQYTLLDGAAAMLEEAKKNLGEEGISFVQQDFADDLPEGPWDAVVSGLAIHHFHDEGKRSLYQRIHEGLSPGGVFVNAEHVSGPTPLLDRYYQDWHEASARAAGSDDAEWALALDRMSHDELSPLEDQLDWLRNSGFTDVDCFWKDHFFAVMIAIKGE